MKHLNILSTLSFVCVAFVGACVGSDANFYWPAPTDASNTVYWTPATRDVKCAANGAECNWPPKHYKLFPNMGYYKFYAYGATWQYARMICEDEGAHLVIINSEKEATIMRALFEANPTSVAAKNNLYAWVGVHERGENGKYYTIFGDKLQETGFWRWCPKEPNDNGTDDCLVIRPGGLGDESCAIKYPFICEIELSQVEIRRRWLQQSGGQ